MKKFILVAKFLIGWPFAVLALYFVGRLFFAQKNILNNLQAINPLFVAVSLILFLAFFFLRALFWQKLLQKKGIHFSYKITALTWGLSEFKRYIPGNIWPILGRSSAYEKLGTGKKEILTGILHEAQFLLISCLLVSLVSLNFLFFDILHIPYAVLFITISIVGTFLLAGFFLFHRSLFPKKLLFTYALPHLSFFDSLNLLILSTGAFLLFGLANYFAVFAVSPLYLLHILPLVGFFVFAFLAGYISFLAPMGLGVREGILTIGLARYIPLHLAAFGALIARLLQIAGELLFLGICIFWNKLAGKKSVQAAEHFFQTYRYEIAAGFSIVGYTVYFTMASFLKYANFFTGRFDLGNMDQTVWNTIHGRIFQLTDPNGTAIVSRLSFHADFMLIFLAPLYAIWQDPRMLLLMQSLAIGIGGIFIFLIGKTITKQKSVALAFTISYLLYPALEYANLYDFHAVTLAIPLFLASWYLIMKNRLFWAAVLLLLAATSKEQVWLIIGLFGIYFLFWRKKYILGISFTALGFALFYYLVKFAIPAAHGGSHFALSYYSDFGSSPLTIAKNILLSPVKTVSTIFGKGQLIYLLGLSAPLGFLSLLGFPILILVSPDLAVSLLSQNKQLHTIYYHYGAIPTPFFFIAALYGFAFLAKRYAKLMQRIGIYIILVSAIVCAYFLGPLPGAFHPSIAMYTDQLPYATLVDNFLLSIPKKYSVAATNNIGSHLSHRREIFTIPIGLKDADIVVFLLNDAFAQPSLIAQKAMALQLDADPLYTKLISYQDFVVYKKKSVPTYSQHRNHNILPIFKGN